MTDKTENETAMKVTRRSNRSEKLSIVAVFTDELVKVMGAESRLKLTISNFSIFDSIVSFFQDARGFSWADEIENSDTFDFILGNLPLGMGPRKDYEFGSKKLKIRKNWVEILKSVKFLNGNGAALYLVEPTCFSSSEGKKFEDALNSEGYFVNAIFNTPEGILQPEVSITPVLVLITKKKTSSVFLAELMNEAQASEVVHNFYSEMAGNELSKGMAVEERTFYGFHRVKIKQQIEKLETQYKEYEEYTIGDIAKEINYVSHGNSLVEKKNSVYIPKIGNSVVVSKLSDTTIKHHNYFQVVVGEKAISGYVAAFFRSDLGRLILQSLVSGAIIPHLNKCDLAQATIALPSLNDQKQILVTQQKLCDLKDSIDTFDSELALNPTSSISILDQLDKILAVIGCLTDADEVRGLIRQGESKSIELKETLSLCVEKKTKEKYIELTALKTIVGFLNSEGGTLLVGVADNGEITGIDIEIDKFHKGSVDKLLLHVKNLIKERIGEDFYPYIEHKLVSFSNKGVLLVRCKKSETPCYLDGKDFYVRTNPATDKLEGQKLVKYVMNHFGQ